MCTDDIRTCFIVSLWYAYVCACDTLLQNFIM